MLPALRQNQGLDRFVALKLLPDKLAKDPLFAERFNREGRVLAKLNHANIVSVYDFGQAGGFYYLAMEYVDGVNLRQAMRAGRFSPTAALGIERCDLLGHSMGGMLAQRVALAAPQRVASLVLLSTSAEPLGWINEDMLALAARIGLVAGPLVGAALVYVLREKPAAVLLARGIAAAELLLAVLSMLSLSAAIFLAKPGISVCFSHHPSSHWVMLSHFHSSDYICSSV